MIKVKKDEADYIRENSQNVRFAITGKGKKSRGKRWYIDESVESMTLLEQYRANITICHYNGTVRRERP